MRLARNREFFGVDHALFTTQREASRIDGGWPVLRFFSAGR